MALGFNVTLDSRLTSRPAYSIDEISVGPELSTPQPGSKLGKTFEYFSGRQTLYYPGYFGWRIHGYGLNEKVDVILVCPDLDEVYLVSLGNLQAHVFNFLVYLDIEPLLPSLAYTHQMVQQNRNIVALVKKYAHPTSLTKPARQAAGNGP